MNLFCIADFHYATKDELNTILTTDKNSYDAIALLGDNHDTLLKNLADTLLLEKPYVAVKGNHDYLNSLSYLNIEDFHGKTKAINDITFGGLEGSFRYKNGPFPALTQEEAHEILTNMPYVDILISHNSPKDFHERDWDVHQGFVALNNYIVQFKPKLVVHGHQHINKCSFHPSGVPVLGVYGAVLLNTETLETKILC